MTSTVLIEEIKKLSEGAVTKLNTSRAATNLEVKKIRKNMDKLREKINRQAGKIVDLEKQALDKRLQYMEAPSETTKSQQIQLETALEQSRKDQQRLLTQNAILQQNIDDLKSNSLVNNQASISELTNIKAALNMMTANIDRDGNILRETLQEINDSTKILNEDPSIILGGKNIPLEISPQSDLPSDDEEPMTDDDEEPMTDDEEVEVEEDEEVELEEDEEVEVEEDEEVEVEEDEEVEDYKSSFGLAIIDSDDEAD